MIKQMIEEEAYLRNKAEDISDEITKKLKPIFKRLLNEYLHHPYCDGANYQAFKKQLGRKKAFEFNRWSALDGYRIDGDDILLHYYDDGYDCYESEEFSIPLSVVEDELSPIGKGDETIVWYRKQLDEAQQRVEKEKKENKKKQEDEEYQKYLKLKDKYEGE